MNLVAARSLADPAQKLSSVEVKSLLSTAKKRAILDAKQGYKKGSSQGENSIEYIEEIDVSRRWVKVGNPAQQIERHPASAAQLDAVEDSKAASAEKKGNQGRQRRE